MTCLSVRYKKEFVHSFGYACKKIGIKQSDGYREAMRAVIDQANKQE